MTNPIGHDGIQGRRKIVQRQANFLLIGCDEFAAALGVGRARRRQNRRW